MSRAQQTPSWRLRVIPTALGLAALLGLAGCGVGQVTQTDSMEPAVNGAQGQVGPIAIRDAQFAFPRGGAYPAKGEASLVLTIVNTGATDDELVGVSSPVAENDEITGDHSLPGRRALAVGTPDKEVSPRASSSVVMTTATPSSSTSTSGTVSSTSTSGTVSSTSTSGTVSSSSPSGSASSVAPSSGVAPTSSSAAKPAEIGMATIVLKGLTSALAPGMTYSVTFQFRDAGSITIDLPIAAPTSARPEPTGGHG